MKLIRLFAFTLSLLTSIPSLLSAQVEFCYGLQDIIAASYTKFDELPADYAMELVGQGASADTKIYYSKWHKDFTFSNRQEAIAKYDELAARLSNCKIDGDALEYTEDAITQKKLVDRIKVGRWMLPANHPYAEVFIEMELTQMVNAFALTFDVNNGDLNRLYTSKAPPVARHARSATAPRARPVTLCSAIDRILESPMDFASIKGKQKSSAGTMGIYETSVSVPAAQESSLYASSVAPPSYVARFLTTTDEAVAKRKYEELKQQLSSCDLQVGSLTALEKDLEEGKVTSFTPVNLPDDKAARYGNLIIELVIDKNHMDYFEVELKISYTN